MKIEITSFNQGETDNLKREDFKTLVLQLPIVLVGKMFVQSDSSVVQHGRISYRKDTESEDYQYF